MRTLLAVLLALAMVAVPAVPLAGAQGADQAPPSNAAPTASDPYEGDHVEATVDTDLPGIANLTLVASGERVLDEIRLPSGENLTSQADEDGLRVEDEHAEVRIEDSASVPAELDADDEHLLTLVPSAGVDVEAVDGGFNLTPDEGPSLAIRGAVTQDGDRLLVTDAGWHIGQAAPDDRAADDEDQADENADEDDGSDGDAATQRRGPSGDHGQAARTAENASGEYRVGPATLTLEDERIRDLNLRETPVFDRIELPGLEDPSAEKRGSSLSVTGDSARLSLSADAGFLLHAQANDEIELRLAEGVEVQQREDHALVHAGSLTLVVEGDELELEDRRLTVEDHVRVAGKSGAPGPLDPVWEREAPRGGPVDLPREVNARFAGFTLTEEGLENLTIHGTPLGDVRFDTPSVQTVRRTGAALHAQGPGYQARIVDAPATQIHVSADDLTADLPDETALPSGATVTVDKTPDSVHVHLQRPTDVVANRTIADHREVPVTPAEGPAPGLEARTANGSLGVSSQAPNRVSTSFDGQLNGTEGNVSLDLDLVRAMLVEDANGNGKVDVGDPAVARQSLDNGTSEVRGDALVNRFALWSGTLDVIVEPGEHTAKITYEVHNLSAPPGTLFVLETEVEAPADAGLHPTANGVAVENGSMAAEYSVTGPVTVDDAEGWAHRSIFVDRDDSVRVLVAYPAGDNITHDPTVAVQSTAVETVTGLAASPYAIAAGALGAALIVGVTAYSRRGPGGRA